MSHGANPPVDETGRFERDTRYLDDRILDDPEAAWPVEPGRYRLVVARACPWAHRAVIVRRLLGLEDALSLGLAGPTHDWRSWRFDLDPGEVDPVLGIHRLREAFLARDPHYDRGITVPAIIDVPSGQVVTNDFRQITVDLATQWQRHHRDGAPDLYPPHLRAAIEEISEPIYREVNNGVYEAGFATSQSAYEQAHRQLFDRLDALEQHLATRRYLVGDHLTEADIRLFTTLVRFDAVYHLHFRCNRSKLAELPVLWAYARDLFQTPGFGDTTDFTQIKQHYYLVHTDLNPSGIIPAGPSLGGWAQPHHREQLGGTPFGEATPPAPPPPAERVPTADNPALSTLGGPTAEG